MEELIQKTLREELEAGTAGLDQTETISGWESFVLAEYTVADG